MKINASHHAMLWIAMLTCVSGTDGAFMRGNAIAIETQNTTTSAKVGHRVSPPVQLSSVSLGDPTGPFPNIVGPFEAKAKVVFSNVGAVWWQRVFDFGNGPWEDNVLLTQKRGSNNMTLSVHRDGVDNACVAPGSIIQGEVAEWTAGVTAWGQYYINKNSVRIATCEIGVLPKNVQRENKFIGQSNWEVDTPLAGDVLSFTVQQHDTQGSLPDITGAFTAEATAVFRDLSAGRWQRVFDFGNGQSQDNIILTQKASSNDMRLGVYVDRTEYVCEAPGTIIEGEVATWTAQVTERGVYTIDKNSVRVATCYHWGKVPRNVFRQSKRIGQSAWATDTPLAGEVLALTIRNSYDNSKLLPEITGAFVATATVVFRDLAVGRWSHSKQTVFDFGNGPKRDNVILSQRKRSSRDMVLQKWNENGIMMYECVAYGAIIEGEVATWTAQITAQELSIDKNFVRVATCSASAAGAIPANVPRKNKLVGRSNWKKRDPPLVGEVFSLRIDNVPIAVP